MNTLKQLLAALCIFAGLALAGYALVSLIELPSFVLGKFSSDARDTSTGILFFLIGAALAVTGLSNLELGASRQPPQSVSGNNTPPET